MAEEQMGGAQTAVLALSGVSEQDLWAQVRGLLGRYGNSGVESCADFCAAARWSLEHKHRLSMVVNHVETACADLQAALAGSLPASCFVSSAYGGAAQAPQIAFLFTGQGAQYVGMGRTLYEASAVFRRAFDVCDELLEPILGRSLLAIVYPHEGDEILINQTAFTQPALFSLEYALVQYWASVGVCPDVVMGHSVGEYAAACAAGALSLSDAIRLIAERGRLMQTLPPGGSMSAVRQGLGQIETTLKRYAPRVSIAAFNGPRNVVVSGEGEAVEELCRELKQQGVVSRSLQVSHAFHSCLMEPVLGDFETLAADVCLNSARINLISNLSGDIAGGEITEPAYWVRHIREPVQFEKGMRCLANLSCDVVIEVGPHPTLLAMGSSCVDKRGLWVPSLRRSKDDIGVVLDTTARLFAAGVGVCPRHALLAERD